MQRSPRSRVWPRSDREQRLRAELLDAKAARALEPELAEDVVAALHYPDEAQVDPPALMRALAIALVRAKVVVREGTNVQALAIEGDACRGVALADETLGADATVLAAGSWSSLVAGLPAHVPVVKPARGQMVLLQQTLPALRAIVLGGETYAVPRGDGRVLCGSTVELAGFRREVTAGGVRAILDGVLACVPKLASAPVSSMWSGFRPFAGTDEPIVGASPLPGLFLATGHFRNGILLARVTAEAIATAVLG